MAVLRHAFRQLFKSPGFTLVSILTLALGIGATSAIFTVVNAVLLRPIDYPDSKSLVVIRQSLLPQYPTLSVCPADYLDFRARGDRFEAMYAARGDSVVLTGRGEPVRLRALRATSSYFETLRVQPDQGRAFTTEEDTPGANRVVVLLHNFWQTKLGGRPDVLGQTLILNGQPSTIIGIMPADFRVDPVSDVLTPIAFTAEQAADRGHHHVRVVARLAPGIDLAEANVQLATLADQLAAEYPEDNVGWGAFALPLLDWHIRDMRTTLYTLLAAVAFLLLIACVNVGNLTLVRATARNHEIALRAALGAGRWRLTRMLVAESLVLGLIGGAAGLLLAHWGLDALLALGGDQIPRADEVRLDHRVVGFTFALSFLTGIVFGLVPIGRTDPNQLIASLKSGPRGTEDDLRHHSLRQWLIVIEIALALILLNTAGLFGRSFLRLAHTYPGFDASGAWWVGLEVPPETYETPEQQTAFVRDLDSRLHALPGMTAVGTASVMPFTGENPVLRIEFPNQSLRPDQDATGYYSAISPDYLATMRIPLLSGRNFTDDDRANTRRVAIVSEAFGHRYFPGEDPLGQLIHITNTISREPEWREIVGVVANVKQYGLDQVDTNQVYEPFAQQPSTRMSFVVRTADTGPNLAASIRAAVQAVDPDQPVFSLRPVADLIATSVSRQRFALVLLWIFSGLALILAVVGTYAVVSYSVAMRTREIGVRMALGASAGRVRRVVFTKAMRLVSVGLLVGTVASLAIGKIVAAQLHATSSRDPVVLGSIALLLAAVSAVACFIPARRATRVDPMVALRAE